MAVKREKRKKGEREVERKTKRKRRKCDEDSICYLVITCTIKLQKFNFFLNRVFKQLFKSHASVSLFLL